MTAAENGSVCAASRKSEKRRKEKEFRGDIFGSWLQKPPSFWVPQPGIGTQDQGFRSGRTFQSLERTLGGPPMLWIGARFSLFVPEKKKFPGRFSGFQDGSAVRFPFSIGKKRRRASDVQRSVNVHRKQWRGVIL